MILKLIPERMMALTEDEEELSRQRDSMCKSLEAGNSMGHLRKQTKSSVAGMKSVSGPFEGKGVFLSLNWLPLHLFPFSFPPPYRKTRPSLQIE